MNIPEGYYKPDSSEFCIGFEYERKEIGSKMIPGAQVVEKWHKDIYDPKDFMTVYNYDDWSFDLQEEIDKGDIIVKYLSKEDILSCGFYCRDEIYYTNSQDYELSYLNKYNKWYIIKIEDIPEDCTLIFSGKIKNLTEFKKLLKQLDIK